MKFMMIVKASKESEAGVMPTKGLLSAMGKYNEELMKAGVLLDLNGLQASSKGARVKFSRNKISVVDGPFTEATELVAGYWIIQVNSRAEAIDWAMKAPMIAESGPDEAEIEIRQIFELEDFEPSEAVDRARELSANLK